MTENNKAKTANFEMEIELPRILPGPIQLADGALLAVGDQVEHVDLGKGTVVRIAEYENAGVCLYLDFENGVDKIIGINFVKMVK